MSHADMGPKERALKALGKRKREIICRPTPDHLRRKIAGIAATPKKKPKKGRR